MQRICNIQRVLKIYLYEIRTGIAYKNTIWTLAVNPIFPGEFVDTIYWEIQSTNTTENPVSMLYYHIVLK